MLTLIVEDDSVSRLILRAFLKEYGLTHIAVNGTEALKAVRLALESSRYYDLICLDIMMPEMDGQHALKEIRALEEASGIFPPNGAKIVMTTAITERESVLDAQRGGADQYLVKPIFKAKVLHVLRTLGLVV